LVAHAEQLHAAIDRSAGAFKGRFVTSGPGQAEIYQEKVKEATAWSENPTGVFLFLQAEADACGMTLAQVATIVNQTVAQWRPLGAAIEGMRMAAKRAVSVAMGESDWAAMSAAANVDWETLLT
jgi:hypothetical protein